MEKAEEDIHNLKSKVSNYERITRIENTEQRDALISEIVSFFNDLDKETIDNLPIYSLKSIGKSLSLGAAYAKFKKFTALTSTKDEVIAAYQGGKLLINIKNFNNVMGNTKKFFDRSVVKFTKKIGIREFAIDTPEQVKIHIILHELGHKVYSESKLTDKYEKLKKLKKQSIENNSILSISWYAKNSSDIEDFFSEIFAVYARGGNLPEEMKLYVLEVIDAGI